MPHGSLACRTSVCTSSLGTTPMTVELPLAVVRPAPPQCCHPWVQDWVQVAGFSRPSRAVSCAGSTIVLTATNQEVAGSSPAGPATVQTSAEFLRSLNVLRMGGVGLHARSRL